MNRKAMAEVGSEKAICAMKQQRPPQLVWLSVYPDIPHTLIRVREGLRAGEVVGEGRVEEGGGVRGS